MAEYCVLALRASIGKIDQSTYDGHLLLPAIVVARGQEQVAAVALEDVGEVGGTSADVEVLMK